MHPWAHALTPTLVHTGTPEARGKAEWLTTVVSGLNKWQASTLGLATVYQWLQGSLQLHQRAMWEVTARQPPHVPDKCFGSLVNV